MKSPHSDSGHLTVMVSYLTKSIMEGIVLITGVEFYLYPTVGTVLIHSVKPELTE